MLLSRAGGRFQWIFTGATHSLKISGIPGGHFCSGALSDCRDQSIRKARFAFTQSPCFACEDCGSCIIGGIGTEGWQVGDSIRVELRASLPQRCIGDSVDPEQELSSDDIGSANRACPPQPGDKGGMAALAFDEDVCINEPGHDPLPHLALRFLGRRHPPRLGRESVRGTTRPLAGRP